MTKPTRVAALYLALVFVAGALFGLVSHSLYNQRTARASTPQEMRDRYVAKLRKDLDLTHDQLAQVTAIIDETGERFREIRGRMEPEFEAIRQKQRERVMAVLTPEQQPKYQKILEEHRRAREERNRASK